MSSYASGRLSGILATCLLGGLLTFGAHAQTSAPVLLTVAFNTLPALQASTPIPGSSHVPGDFNRDGTSDLLWFNPKTSQLTYWTMSAVVNPYPDYADNGSVTRTGVSNTFNVTQGYFVGAVGDFNDDGYADIVFTSANNDLWLWTNSQTGGFNSTKIGTYPSNWQLVGAGDVDGDGYDDLLWVDAQDCQFGYWTMHGATQTGTHVMPAPCGYYPVAVGYFTPTNRISIMWSSAANDLIVWDSTGTGFTSYDLTSYLNYTNFPNRFSLGGGYMGTGIGIDAYTGLAPFTQAEAGSGMQINRSFDAENNQTGVSINSTWSQGLISDVFSAGYVIQGNGVNQTGLYVFDAAESLLSTGGLGPNFGGSAPPISGNAASGPQWTYPIGWSVVGSPANVMTAPPWPVHY